MLVNKFSLWLLCILLIWGISGCSGGKPIQIGFVTQLSGQNSALGVQGRNGAQLAIQKIKQEGGIKGHPVELITRDNGGDADATVKADLELIDQQVVAISGHLTSWEAIAAQSLYIGSDMVFISPTTSTPQLSGMRDSFFRLIPVNSAQAIPIADYTYTEKQVKTAVILRDTDNDAFSQPYAAAFQKEFERLGGQVLNQVEFKSSQKPNFAELTAQLSQTGAGGMLIIASSFDTAMIAQETKILNWPVQLITANWAFTDDLSQNGGQAVEGILISSHYDENCDTPQFKEFRTLYQTTYGDPPSFVSVLSYETILVLRDALLQTDGKAAGLAQVLATPRTWIGLCDKIVFDENGDVQRNVHIMTVQDGHFTLLKSYDPMP